MEQSIRWPLILGEADPQKALDGESAAMDGVLKALYDNDRSGGLGDSSPQVHRWLGDIRTFFPTPVVQLMQRDAFERLGLHSMLLEPELLSMVEPDARLIGILLSLNKALPDQTRETARLLVRRYAEDLQQRLRNPLLSAVRGSLSKLQRTQRPHHHEVDWRRTIQANLKHYQAEWGTVIPEKLFGRQKSQRRLKHLVLLLDQSGSMAPSIVHAGILGCILASIPTLKTHLAVFDTNIADLSHLLGDPVDLLFATQLGGGTHIAQALAYGRQWMENPGETIFILLSDLMEGPPPEEMLRQAAAICASGARLIVLLSLDDSGTPSFDRSIAAQLARMGVPAFACTPGKFPEIMSAALEGRPLEGIVSGPKFPIP